MLLLVRVVVTNESNMASYFPEAGNLNGCNADMCSDVAGPSSSVSGDFFEFSDPLLLLFPPMLTLLAAILNLSVTTTPILPFGTCYVIMHKVYWTKYYSFLVLWLQSSLVLKIIR